MSPLDEYQRKRHFDKTPEPGAVAAGVHAGGLSYVIQKHAASRLHYDFRIELDGVMLSWAVPKGPSLDPKDKRLAMHVEDHPVAYSGFEGTIPKGEYGGGTVMLWDRGTWEPDHGDPVQHLADGHLKFALHGERLRGRWMLVRTKGYGGKSSGESWLLFKEHDEEERPRSEYDVTAEWMTSVATGRTMEQIAENADAVWHSDASVEENVAALGDAIVAPAAAPGPNGAAVDVAQVAGARRAPMPHDAEVSLATLVDEPPSGDGWLHEIKFDGYRILGYLDGGSVRLVSRNGKDWTERLRSIAEGIAALPAEQAIVDGEVVVMRADGITDFQALQNHAKSGTAAELTFMAFDLLHVDGYDVSGSPLVERKRLLAGLLRGANTTVHYTEHIEGRGAEFFENSCRLGLEGVISKRRNDIYRHGRSKSWLKVKCLLRQEFAVVGWTDPGGARKGFGALVLAVREGDDLVHVGRVGTGFTEASIADILGRLEPLGVDAAPVANPPKGPAARGIHWVRPELVAEVAFAEWTGDRSLRHPSFKGLRDDKAADEVVVEQAQDTDVVAAQPDPEPAAKQKWSGVALTNPDRILWPDVPFTKAQLAEYYEAVADLMLPHVAHRPLSLVRCPSGYTGECFYQKHIENFPRSVGTVDIFEPEEGGSKPYGTVSSLAGLVGLAQMGVLEIHPWGSRNDDPDKPDRLVFDLDPDPELPFRQIAATALLLRSELSRLGLESWLKTTGGKGLHVVVPMTRRLGWEAAKSFSAGFVESIVAIEPRMFTSNMRMAKRGGRIFIDYLRNARGATAIAPYSTRARPGAPVAVPLEWDEIGSEQRPEYTVRTVAERLSGLRADPWAGLLTARQSVTKEMLERVGAKSDR